MDNSLIFIIGFIIAFLFGFTARHARFCTMASIEAAFIGDNRDQFRIWMLAIAVAILGTRYLVEFHGLDLTATHYLSDRLALGGAIVGGALFGLGMAFVGTCGFGSLLRLAAGDMRGLVAIVLIGIVGYATVRGLVAVPRLFVNELTDIPLPENHTTAMGDVITLAVGSGDPAITNTIAALVIAALLLVWCFKSPTFRTSPMAYGGGILIGLLAVALWGLSGVIAYDEFEPVVPIGFTFVSPLGETVLYTMLSTGWELRLSVVVVIGLLLGGFVSAWLCGELRLDAFDDAVEMRRHIVGSILMGFGGALAGGCTIGQGLTGVSTLSVTSYVAFISMIVASVYGIKHVIGFYNKCY